MGQKSRRDLQSLIEKAVLGFETKREEDTNVTFFDQDGRNQHEVRDGNTYFNFFVVIVPMEGISAEERKMRLGIIGIFAAFLYGVGFYWSDPLKGKEY